MADLLVREGLAGKRSKPDVEPAPENLRGSKAVGPRPLLDVVPRLAVNNLREVVVVELGLVWRIDSITAIM